MTYLDLLVVICLRYVQGQAIESMSPKFYSENAVSELMFLFFVDCQCISLRILGVVGAAHRGPVRFLAPRGVRDGAFAGGAIPRSREE
jgi:hypothetical protein